MKNIQKNKRNLLLFGEEIQNLGGGGGNSPPKGPEKNTDPASPDSARSLLMEQVHHKSLVLDHGHSLHA